MTFMVATSMSLLLSIVQYLYILFYHKYESSDFHTIVYLTFKKSPTLHLRYISASCGVKTSHLVDCSMTRSLRRVFVYIGIAISVRGWDEDSVITCVALNLSRLEVMMLYIIGHVRFVQFYRPMSCGAHRFSEIFRHFPYNSPYTINDRKTAWIWLKEALKKTSEVAEKIKTILRLRWYQNLMVKTFCYVVQGV